MIDYPINLVHTKANKRAQAFYVYVDDDEDDEDDYDYEEDYDEEDDDEEDDDEEDDDGEDNDEEDDKKKMNLRLHVWGYIICASLDLPVDSLPYLRCATCYKII